MGLKDQIVATVAVIVPLVFVVSAVQMSVTQMPPVLGVAVQPIIAGIVFVIYFKKNGAGNGDSPGRAMGRAAVASVFTLMTTILEFYLYIVKLEIYNVLMESIYLALSIALSVTITYWLFQQPQQKASQRLE